MKDMRRGMIEKGRYFPKATPITPQGGGYDISILPFGNMEHF
jgi:hypothetical protein